MLLMRPTGRMPTSITKSFHNCTCAECNNAKPVLFIVLCCYGAQSQSQYRHTALQCAGSCRASNRDGITAVFSMHCPHINTGVDVDRINSSSAPQHHATAFAEQRGILHKSTATLLLLGHRKSIDHKTFTEYS